jgi:hypothetical protein
MLSTATLLAKRRLNQRLGKEAADWAALQLELGRDGKYLRQLAGVLGHENPFELAQLFDLCAREQNLRLPKTESIVILYAQEYCRQFGSGDIGREYLLYRLYGLCVGDQMRRELMPFYRLYFALDDLRHQTFSHYRRGVDLGNIGQILQDEIRKLMAIPIAYEPRMDPPSQATAQQVTN